MELEELNIFTVSAKSDIKQTSTYISVSRCVSDVNFSFIENNKEKLSVIYNKALDEAKKEGLDHLVICHDDIDIEYDPREKLGNLFKRYDIVGVAGTSKMEIQSPALWHLMGGGFQGGNLRGAVAHGVTSCKTVTSFGPFPSRVVAIDGVFMAFNRKAIEAARFDEECPSYFHFYDCILCLRSLEKGLKIGVGDIMITHQSPGLREFSEDWKVGEQYFISKYGN